MQLFIHWNPGPDALNLGFYAIKWYGVMWGSALLSTFFIGRYVLQQLGRNDEKLTILIQYIFVGGLVGARLAQVLFYELDYFIANPTKIIAVWEGGLASHGGVVGGTVGLLLFCKRHKDWPLFWTLDMAALTVVLLASLIRFGNLMNSEIVGMPTQVPWAFVFEQYDNVPRHPVVLYESIAYLIIQVVQLYLFKQYKESKPGIYLTVFLIGVFTVRFLLEFLKEPDGLVLGGIISKTQLLNLPFIATGLLLAWLMANKRLKYTPATNA